jgi:hypothetical protein
MAGQQFGAALGKFGELALKRFSDPGMKSPSRLTKKSAVGRILDQSMFKQIVRVRRQTLAEKETAVTSRSSADRSCASGWRTTACKSA